jgi:hypothetical protein
MKIKNYIQDLVLTYLSKEDRLRSEIEKAEKIILEGRSKTNQEISEILKDRILCVNNERNINHYAIVSAIGFSIPDFVICKIKVPSIRKLSSRTGETTAIPLSHLVEV